MQTKKRYVTPTLKEHGIVRELTQASSGGRGFGLSHKKDKAPKIKNK